MRLVVVALASLLAVPAAGAELTRPQKVTDMTALVAGRNVDVACETDTQAWDLLIASHGTGRTGRDTHGFYLDNTVRLSPPLCAHLEGLDMGALGWALMILAHEASHARGVLGEAWANCWGLVWAQDLARRFYRIEFFTSESDRVGASALALYRASPPEYRSAC